jgi:ubiquinone/menaquinone biosynthesis C-methylase UbiE
VRPRSWAELAGWYDEKQGDEGDVWHRTFLDPALFAFIGDVSSRRVLDVPCGNGHNTRRLARLGAQVTGLDASAPIIARDREREEREPLGIVYHVADAARMDPLESDSFDLVLCRMGLMDIPDAAGAIREFARVLHPAGRLVALFSHPCFDVPEASDWVSEQMGAETTVWRKVRRYAEPAAGKIHWRMHGEMVSTVAYHRPLSWYVRQLRDAGLVLTALEEPVPPEEFISQEAQGAWMAEVPLHILIEARKAGALISPGG